MATDSFGRAVRDHHRSERTAPLVYHDGAERATHPIEEFYFSLDEERVTWLESWLDGPLLDVGAGAGEHVLHFQESTEVVALEHSEALVETMRERGVEDARYGDMFDLQATVESGRFRSVLVNGTQAGLAGSMQGLREFLGDITAVTGESATAIVDSYDPTLPETADLLGYRDDPTPGLAYRVLTFEYEGESGPTLLFRLFSPGRFRAATDGTDWRVAEVVRPAETKRYYQVALQKE